MQFSALQHRHRKITGDFFRKTGQLLRLTETVLASWMECLRRLTLAQFFLLSGLVKLGNWDNALYLSAHEYPVSWLNPVTAAYLGVAIEIVCPILLMLGLMTRFAAIPLLALTVVSQIYYQPINAQVFWILILGYWCVKGAGKLSVDALLVGLKDSALPLSGFFSRFFAFLTTHVTPFYILLLRCWIAVVLYIAGHDAMQSMGLAEPLRFLAYQPQFSVLRSAETSILVSFISSPAFALCLVFGFSTRFLALCAMIILGIFSQKIDATPAQQSEYIFWIMTLTILFFSGAGTYSLDTLLRKILGRFFPSFTNTMPPDASALPHVVIIGGGFGGLATAKALANTSCTITLIDKHNYHLFQPLLYQVATAGLSPSDIASPIRGLFREQANIRVMLGEVNGIDSETRHVMLQDNRKIAYDYLVLATGARHSYFGKDAWAQFAPGMKNVEDAIAVRGKLLRAFEQAENSDDPEEQAKMLTFVIVGGGPTGVELAGALAELAHHGMQGEFRRIDPAMAKIYLIEAGPRLLAVMPEANAAFTQHALERLGVTVMTGGKVEAIDADGVFVNGHRISSKNVIWAAGVQASPAAQWLHAESDRAGRLIVNRDLTVPGHPSIYGIGDTVMAEVWNGKQMPGLAPAAKQSGQFVARHIRHRIENRPVEAEFHYRHYGSLATIGRKAAIADFGKFRIEGALAWWFWGMVHILFLANMHSRIAIMVEWFWSYLTFKRSTRLITEPRHPE